MLEENIGKTLWDNSIVNVSLVRNSNAQATKAQLDG
jgi:hypothetical protein